MVVVAAAVVEIAMDHTRMNREKDPIHQGDGRHEGVPLMRISREGIQDQGRW